MHHCAEVDPPAGHAAMLEVDERDTIGPDGAPSGVAKLGGHTADALAVALLRESHKLPHPAGRSPLSVKALQAAAVLMQMTGAEWPSVSHEQLGQRIGLKPRQTQTIVGMLKDHGLIEVHKGRGRENTYDLNKLVHAVALLLEAA